MRVGNIPTLLSSPLSRGVGPSNVHARTRKRAPGQWDG